MRCIWMKKLSVHTPLASEQSRYQTPSDIRSKIESKCSNEHRIIGLARLAPWQWLEVVRGTANLKLRKIETLASTWILRWFWETNSLTFSVASNETGGWCLILKTLHHNQIICKKGWKYVRNLAAYNYCPLYLQQAQGMGQAITTLTFMGC